MLHIHSFFFLLALSSIYVHKQFSFFPTQPLPRKLLRCMLPLITHRHKILHIHTNILIETYALVPLIN